MSRVLLFANLFLVCALLLSACQSGAATQPPAVGPTAAADTSDASSEPISVAPSESVPIPSPPEGTLSTDLINAALESGQIDEITALKYKVFAQFFDSRLPPEYLGAANLSTDSHIVDELQAKFFSLSAEDQAAMLPFLVPPVYRGSWGDPAFSPSAPSSGANAPTYKPDNDSMANDLPCDYLDQENWDSLTALHSPVRFWWLKSRPGDAAVVQRYLTAMDDDVWPKLTGLMDRTPKADGGYLCNGGSPEFDVYVTPEVARSYAASLIPPGCRETPSYIVINPSASDGILAHEFMHAIQWSYNTALDCMYPGDYAWLAEATATWSQNFVYPNTNEEHYTIPWFFKPKGPGGRGPNLELRNDQHEYGAYLFFFYLTKHFDKPEIVRDAWDNSTSMGSLAAVDQAIEGGFDAVWADFAVKNLNEPPYDDYQKWDNLNIKPSGASLSKTVAALGTYDQDKQVDHLSIFYDWFTFTPEDRLVAFYNGNTFDLGQELIAESLGITEIADGTTQYSFTPREDEAAQSVKVQALYRLAGEVEWVLEDWSDKPYVVFCRDAQAEKLQDLIIITSNSAAEGSVTTSGTYPSKLAVQNIGCWRYGGEASVVMQTEDADGILRDEQQVPNVAFERTENHENYSYPFLHLKVAEGQWQRTYLVDMGESDCTVSGDASGPLPRASGGEYADEIMILYGAITGPSFNRYTAEASPKQTVETTYYCPENTPPQPEHQWSWVYLDMLSMTLDKVYTVGSDGSLAGSDDFLWDVEGASMLYTWNFVPLSEP